MIALNNLKLQNAHCVEQLSAALSATLHSGWYVLGERVAQFETEFAHACGAAHTVSVANGTDAIEIALRSLGVEEGDSVATVANAGMYSTVAILGCGAKPLYIDVETATMNMSLASIKAAAIKPRALIITHLYGRMADVEALVTWARANKIAVLEDCAQAHGANINGKYAGTFGDIGCFSFYPTKNLGALGDGGAIISNDNGLATRARKLRQYGWGKKYYASIFGGRNSRLDEIQAAVLSVKLPYLADENQRRREITAAYAAGIRNPHIQIFSRVGSHDVCHLYVVCCDQREALQKHLLASAVQSDIHYPLPDYQQAPLAANYADVHLPVTERLCNTVLSLPCHPALNDMEIGCVIDACNRFAL